MNQMQQLLMQANKMQRELQKAHEALNEKEFTASNAGMVEVTMKGDAGKVHLAVWTNGEYTYSISASAGMSRGEMADLIREIA